MARGRRDGEEREEGGKGGKKRKKRKKGEGKKEKKVEKERKWGKGEESKEKGGGAVRASGDRGRGRPRVACGPREVGHASEEREEKGEGKKEGRDSRRLVTTRRVGWEGDETWIEIGCRVRSPGIGRSEQEGFREVRVRV